jgi:integrase
VKQLANYMLVQGKSRSMVKATLAPLSEMFNHAIEDSHFTAAKPVLRILRRNRTDEGTRHEKVSFLTRDEVTRLLTACREHFAAFYPLVLCLLRTGMRIGEAIALQWGDADLAGRSADVKRNLVDGHLTTPKSGKARRVDLSAQLTETLKALLVERKKETLRHGWGEVPAWVFVNECGNPLGPENFRHRVWPKILAKAELRRVRIHDLRHTYASLLIQQGESLAYVKEQMGHHSIRVTVDTYGHLVPGGNKAAVDRLDDQPAQADGNPCATYTRNGVLAETLTGGE